LLERYTSNSLVRAASVSDRVILDDFHTAFVSPKSAAQDVIDSRIWSAEDRIAQHAVAFLRLSEARKQYGDQQLYRRLYGRLT
jgi:hypothetical protein